MNPTTQELLRKAAMEALAQKQDASAMEILGLLSGTVVATQRTFRTMPLLPDSINPPGSADAHQIVYWEQTIRNLFIPFLLMSGRVRFTSHEMLNWLSNCSDVALTEGDNYRCNDGKLMWRDRASSGLNSLKRQGIVHAETHGKMYEVVDPAILKQNHLEVA